MTERQSTNGILRFSQETALRLLYLNAKRYELTGQSIRDLRAQGLNLESTWHQRFPAIEKQLSKTTEVGIYVREPFLEETEDKKEDRQFEIFDMERSRLRELIPTVDLVIGEVPDYVELIFKRMQRPGVDDFWERIEDRWIKTTTMLDNRNLMVRAHNGNDGYGHPARKIEVERQHPNSRYTTVMPLFIPKS